MHRRALPFAFGLMFIVSAMAVAAQEEALFVLRLEGHEGPLACDVTARQLLCFHIVEGDPASVFVAGSTVRVELTAKPLEGAPAGAPHNLAVILDGGQGDLAGIDSDSSNAIAISDTAESGDTVTLEFKVPENGTLYFWCDVGEHEFAGMNFKATVHSAPGATSGGGGGIPVTDNRSGDTNGTSGNGSAEPEPTDDADTGAGNDTDAGVDADVGGDADPPADDGAEVTEDSPGLSILVVPVVALAGLAWARRRR